MSKIYEKYRDLITNPFDIKYKKEGEYISKI